MLTVNWTCPFYLLPRLLRGSGENGVWYVAIRWFFLELIVYSPGLARAFWEDFNERLLRRAEFAELTTQRRGADRRAMKLWMACHGRTPTFEIPDWADLTVFLMEQLEEERRKSVEDLSRLLHDDLPPEAQHMVEEMLERFR